MAAGQTVNFQSFGNRIAQGPNYATQSQAIGDSVNEAIQEQRDREDRARDQERRAAQKEIQNMQIAQMKQQQYESLNVPADTGYVSADQYIQKASRSLVDLQSNLVNQYKNQEIDADQFAQQSAIIKSQVPAISAAKETLTGFQDSYANLLKTDQISAADNGESARLYNALQQGGVSIAAGEDGQLIMTGEPGTEYEDISMPLSQINRIPQPIAKAKTMKELAAGPLSTIGDGPWNPEAVHSFVDSLFTDDDMANDRMLKAIAVDNLGIPLDKANRMLEQSIDGDTGATNELEAFVEQAIYNQAQDQYLTNQNLKRVQELKLANEKIRQQEIQRKAANAGNSMTSQEFSRMEKNENARLRLSSLNERFDKFEQAQPGEAMNLEDGTFIRKMPNGTYMQLSKDRKAMGMPMSPEQVRILFQKGIDDISLNYVKNYKSPTKRSPLRRAIDWMTSPFQASRGARKAAQNEKTKAAHAARTSAQWDERRDDTKTYGDLALSAVKAIPGAALLGTAGSVISDAAGTAQGKGVGKLRAKAISTAAKLAGAGAKEAAKATGAVGLALAAKDIADTFNKVQYQGMTPEEQQKRRTITASQRRGKK